MTLFVKKCQRNASLCFYFCDNTPTTIKLTEITHKTTRDPFSVDNYQQPHA